MVKKNNKDINEIFNFCFGRIHRSPRLSDHINNHGKVADVKTDPVVKESEPNEAIIANKMAKSCNQR